MNHKVDRAIKALKKQGYDVDKPGNFDGYVRVGVRSKDASALVTIGEELQDLAEGRLTLAQIADRRREGK